MSTVNEGDLSVSAAGTHRPASRMLHNVIN
jgi:hypothetical protein